VENSEENKKDGEKTEICGKNESLQELLNFKKICSSRCSICSSDILPEIHAWRKSGKKFEEIIALAKDLHGKDISISALSRHFNGYRAFKMELSTKVLKEDILEEITTQAVHLKKTVELLDLAYAAVLARFNASTYNIDVGDLEKLLKMRYQIIPSGDTEEKDLIAIFQKATNEYGLNLQQATLFSQKRSPTEPE